VVDETEYYSLPFCPDGIPLVPPRALETLRGAIMAEDFECAVGQLPKNRAPGPGMPFEFIQARHHDPACSRQKEGDDTDLHQQHADPLLNLGLICFLLKKEVVLHILGYSPVCLLDTLYNVL
jgi:hypothetical protein